MREKTVTYMGDPDNPWGILYLAGGNPPTAAGLFDQNGNRIAWWPAAIQPMQENIERVVQELVWARPDDEPVRREEITKLLGNKR